MLTKQKLEFAENVVGLIGQHDIDDIFSSEEIKEWSRKNYDPDDIYTDDQLKKRCQNKFAPEDVYSYTELHVWATSNGFAKE